MNHAGIYVTRRWDMARGLGGKCFQIWFRFMLLAKANRSEPNKNYEILQKVRWLFRSKNYKNHSSYSNTLCMHVCQISFHQIARCRCKMVHVLFGQSRDKKNWQKKRRLFSPPHQLNYVSFNSRWLMKLYRCDSWNAHHHHWIFSNVEFANRNWCNVLFSLAFVLN